MSKLNKMDESIIIRVRRARSWLKKAGLAEVHGDSDAEFIFLWISFNALYGTPRYLQSGKPEQSEIGDFRHFVQEVERLSPGSIEEALRGLRKQIKKIHESPFLDIGCWRDWDRHAIRDRQERVSTPRLVSHEPRFDELLTRIYTLRNQLLHGAATDRGERNRESLDAAIPIMRAAIEVCIPLLEKYQTAITGLDSVPFPPSLGQMKQFNVPKLIRK